MSCSPSRSCPSNKSMNFSVNLAFLSLKRINRFFWNTLFDTIRNSPHKEIFNSVCNVISDIRRLKDVCHRMERAPSLCRVKKLISSILIPLITCGTIFYLVKKFSIWYWYTPNVEIIDRSAKKLADFLCIKLQLILMITHYAMHVIK